MSQNENSVGGFWWLFNLLSFCVSTLAIVALLRRSFSEANFVLPLELILKAYNATMGLLLGWAEPYLQDLIARLANLFNMHPILYPHWRDVFVILMLFGVGMIHGWRTEHRGLAVWVALASGPSALTAALLAGMLPIQSDSLLVQLLIASTIGFVAFPLIAILLYDETWHGPVTLSLVLVAVSVISAYLLSYFFPRPAGLGLAGLASCLILTSVGMLWLDHNDTVFRVMARTILGGIFGAVLFFAIDAGTKLVIAD